MADDAPRIALVTSRSFSTGELDLEAELTDAGYRVERGPSDHDLTKLQPLLARAEAWIAGTGPVSEAHLDAAPGLRVLARYGVGTDAVDLAAAARRHIVVSNTPGANTGAVADHTVALILAALRDVSAGDRGVRAGDWTVRRTRELGELSVGIVGLGRIGRAVATRLGGFGSPLLGFDPYVGEDEITALGVEPVGLSELARRSDVVTLHLPAAAVVVDAGFLALLRPSAILVNTARAGLVDEAAVARALRADRLHYYATDVLGSETAVDDPKEHPLLAADLRGATVFTPHAAAQTVEAVDRMGRGAVDAVLAVRRGEPPPHLVALPEPTPTQEVG